MKRLLLGFAVVLLSGACLAADNGIVTVPSKYAVPETLQRLESVLKAKGLIVFARIDHAGEAERAGLKMRPAQLLIFGNPKTGTPLMIASPSVAIDLPLKALAWEDADGKVWLSYNDPAYILHRHALGDEYMKNVAAIVGLVNQALE